MIRLFFHTAHWDTFNENLLNWQKQQNYTKIFLPDTPSLNMKDLKRDSSESLEVLKRRKAKQNTASTPSVKLIQTYKQKPLPSGQAMLESSRDS